MLNTLADLIAEVLSRLSVTASSTFFTNDKVTNAVIQAYSWAIALYEWTHMRRAKTSVTVADQYFYDYPERWAMDSITRLIIDGEKYEQKDFDDFMNYKYQTTGNKTLKIFADYAGQYFVYPTPTVSDLEIIIFGLEMAQPLSDVTDTTIFSAAEEAGNEAVVKKALAILLPAANKKKEGMVEEQEAVALLANLYSKILKRQGKNQRLNKPMFNVPDFFSRNSGNGQNTGNFDY